MFGLSNRDNMFDLIGPLKIKGQSQIRKISESKTHTFNFQCIFSRMKWLIWLEYYIRIIVRQKNRKYYNKKTGLFIKSCNGQTSQIKTAKIKL